MILVICNSRQFELEAYEQIANTFLKNGLKVIYFFQDLCYQGYSFSVKIDENKVFKYIVNINDDSYDISDIEYIWYIKPSVPKHVYEEYQYEYAHFIQKQFYTLREGIRILFENKKWLNNPIKSYTAENKIYQLNVAQSIGFNLPKTLISNDPTEIKDFFSSNDRTIIKALNPTVILNYVIYTNEIILSDLDQISSVKYAPSIYQELIEKKYELRITVVNKTIFAAKVLSQVDIATSIDWRVEPLLNDFSVKFEKTNLPLEVEGKILSFMEALGLNFGCIDMIVTPNDDYIFLEINPNGQWSFIQSNTGYAISDAIAQFFLAQ